jgi:hypothetical protein
MLPCAFCCRYFDADTVGLDFKGMMEDITNAPDGSIMLLHGEEAGGLGSVFWGQGEERLKTGGRRLKTGGRRESGGGGQEHCDEVLVALLAAVIMQGFWPLFGSLAA